LDDVESFATTPRTTARDRFHGARTYRSTSEKENAPSLRMRRRPVSRTRLAKGGAGNGPHRSATLTAKAYRRLRRDGGLLRRRHRGERTRRSALLSLVRALAFASLGRHPWFTSTATGVGRSATEEQGIVSRDAPGFISTLIQWKCALSGGHFWTGWRAGPGTCEETGQCNCGAKRKRAAHRWSDLGPRARDSCLYTRTCELCGAQVSLTTHSWEDFAPSTRICSHCGARDPPVEP